MKKAFLERLDRYSRRGEETNISVYWNDLIRLLTSAATTEARAIMGFVEIVAPFDGVVTRKWVEVGDQTAPGKPLVDIEDPSNLRLEADVPKAIACKIRQDAPMTIRVGQSTGDLSGAVAEIGPIVDQPWQER
jgi:multidrug resistance efflux pump